MPKHTVYTPSEKLQRIYRGGGLKPPKFYPTYYEWLASKGQQISYTKSTKKSSAGMVTHDLYTVPKGSTFFLTNCYLIHSANITEVGGSALGYLRIPSTILLFIEALGYGNTSLGYSINETYLIPFKISGGDKIILYHTVIEQGIVVYLLTVGFKGILIKNKDIPSF